MQRRPLWLVVFIMGGSTLAALALGGGLLGLFLLLDRGTLAPADALQVAGIVALGVGLGIPLLLQSWAGWRGRPSRPFSPPVAWWLWLALVPLLGLGALVGWLSLAPALLLPPIHVLAMSIPPLAILCLVGWALRGSGGSWREVIAGMAGGGFLGMGASLVGEALILLVAAVAGMVVVMLTPGGPERLAELSRTLEEMSQQTNPAMEAVLLELSRFLLSPLIVVSMIGLISIPVPLVEEIFKTLAAGVVARWVRPRAGRAFLWGVAGGAGFALAENLFSGGSLGAESWALGAAARVGTTAMHCFTGGLIGWGWGQLWAARRPLSLLAAYAAAAAVHGLWNAAALGAAFLGISALVHEGDIVRLALVGFGGMILLGMLGALAVAFLIALPLTASRLAARERQFPGKQSEVSVPHAPTSP